ncbi:MAG: hypothetical protein HQK60_11770 [Deltaproteobacteria bacterium]|nr:hypothetical protein [Deltaproteobacteria bacterium]
MQLATVVVPRPDYVSTALPPLLVAVGAPSEPNLNILSRPGNGINTVFYRFSGLLPGAFNEYQQRATILMTDHLTPYPADRLPLLPADLLSIRLINLL